VIDLLRIQKRQLSAKSTYLTSNITIMKLIKQHKKDNNHLVHISLGQVRGISIIPKPTRPSKIM